MLTLNAISKSFPGVRALSGVNLEVRPGEIHGLLGENGAGKSTLIKIIAGAYAPDEGEMHFADAPARWSSPREAKLHGIHVVYQEFALFPQLSVAENIFVGQERLNRFGMVDHGRTRREAKELLEKLDDFRFTHRFESRTETIHWLLEFALKQNPKPNK